MKFAIFVPNSHKLSLILAKLVHELGTRSRAKNTLRSSRHPPTTGSGGWKLDLMSIRYHLWWKGSAVDVVNSAAQSTFSEQLVIKSLDLLTYQTSLVQKTILLIQDQKLQEKCSFITLLSNFRPHSCH